MIVFMLILFARNCLFDYAYLRDNIKNIIKTKYRDLWYSLMITNTFKENITAIFISIIKTNYKEIKKKRFKNITENLKNTPHFEIVRRFYPEIRNICLKSIKTHVS